MNKLLTTQQKALTINLDNFIYGTFAEIGAGQEVAGNFFKAGAASGTVAKSISAYDMVFSDSIYGKEQSGRYVCQSRLEKMIQYEYDLVIERLGKERPNGKFFAFATTVAARNFHGTNEPHGWLGLRLKGNPDEEYSELIVHVKMHDNSNQLQSKAIGVLGVNLIFASYYHDGNFEKFISSLMENLSRHRIEIDMIEVKGPVFKDFDNRLLNLQLVKEDLTDAVMFNIHGKVCLPKDALYKKNILISRGSYRPPTKVNVDVFKTGVANFRDDIGEESLLSLAEITIHNLKESTSEIANDDFLARVDLLTCLGQPVLVTNFPQYYKLSSYLQKFKPKNVGIVLGAYNFMQIFDVHEKEGVGEVLEALGRLFRPGVKIYLYPYRENSQGDELINLDNLPIRKAQQLLLDHIKSLGHVANLTGYDDSLLHIYSRKVVNMIENNNPGWEEFVPVEISKLINDKCLFGHPCPTGVKAK